MHFIVVYSEGMDLHCVMTYLSSSIISISRLVTAMLCMVVWLGSNYYTMSTHRNDIWKNVLQLADNFFQLCDWMLSLS